MLATRLLVAVIALSLSLHAQDSTQVSKPKDSTLMEKMGLRGVHVSFGGVRLRIAAAPPVLPPPPSSASVSPREGIPSGPSPSLAAP